MKILVLLEPLLQERLRNYEKAYETLSDTEGDYSFIKVIDVGKKVCLWALVPFLLCAPSMYHWRGIEGLLCAFWFSFR
jgi:hypothetical protein